MTLELHVATGARAGHRARFAGDRVVVGRDPTADLALDAAGDRDASARHLELCRRDGLWHARDLGSTNGTFVNGRRLAGELAVRDGDRIACGADGPTIVVRLADAPPAAVAPTAVAPARAPHAARRVRGAVAAAALAAVAVAAVAAVVVVQRQAGARVLAADALRAAADSARLASDRDARALAARLAAAEGAPLAGPASSATTPHAGGPARVALAPASLDAAAIARTASRAIALVAVESADGTATGGTAFGVSEDGLLATNRHVLLGATGDAPRRIAVKFAGTDAWLEARLVDAHPDADVATIRIVAPGSYPAIPRVADADPEPGSEIVVLGFPAGAELPRERAAGDGVARAAVFRGLVSKVAEGTIVVDAFAGRGSSGSPVLDARGAVVGVIYGGPSDAAGRVAYAVSSAALRALLR